MVFSVTCVGVYLYVSLSIYLSIYTYIYICMCVYIHIYMYMYTHTHSLSLTHTHTHIEREREREKERERERCHEDTASQQHMITSSQALTCVRSVRRDACQEGLRARAPPQGGAAGAARARKCRTSISCGAN